jgi:hypothetical protein
MRVNIQFSVNLEDIPDHLTKALDDACPIIDNIKDVPVIESLKMMIANNNIIDSITVISDFRESLLDLDHRLDDIMRIMIGYQQVIANPENAIAAARQASQDSADEMSPQEAWDKAHPPLKGDPTRREFAREEMMQLEYPDEQRIHYPPTQENSKDLTAQLRRKVAAVAAEVKNLADDAGGFE